MEINKRIALIFSIIGTMSLHGQTWVHGQMEYIHSIPQTQTKYNNEEVETLAAGFEAEIYHNVSFLPNIKYDMYRNADTRQNNKTLYYSTYYQSFHIDFGATLRDVEYMKKDYSYKHLMGRVKSKVMGKIIAAFTYNYELDNKVNEYTADINYILSKRFPMTIGFQYKSSKMEFEDSKIYKTEGLFLRTGFKF